MLYLYQYTELVHVPWLRVLQYLQPILPASHVDMTGTNVNFALFCGITVYNMLLYTVVGILYCFCMMVMIRGCVLNHARRWLASSWGVNGGGLRGQEAAWLQRCTLYTVQVSTEMSVLLRTPTS